MEFHFHLPGKRWLICPLFLLFAGSFPAAPASPPHARVTLIAEQRSIQPGRQFWVELHFHIEKHWHLCRS